MSTQSPFTPDMLIPQHVQPIRLGLGPDGAHWRDDWWVNHQREIYGKWLRARVLDGDSLLRRRFESLTTLRAHRTRPAWRDNPAQVQATQNLGHRLAALHARAHNGSDPPGIQEALDLAVEFLSLSTLHAGIPLGLRPPIRAAFEELAEVADIPLGFCAQCGEPIDTEGDDNRHSDTYNGLVCESCADDHVYLEDTEQFVDPDRTYVYWAYTAWSRTYGEFTDEQAFGRLADLHLIHPDAQHGHVEYVTTGAYNDSYWDWRDDDEGSGIHPDGQPYEDEEDSEKYGVYGYGSHPYRQPHRGYFDEPTFASDTNIPIGMEFEVHIEGQPLDALRRAGNLDWILERDGSLDHTHGVEIVSPPLCRSQWEDTLPRLIEALQSEDTTAYNPPCGNEYGIHLTIHRQYLTPLQEVRLSMFLLAEENGDFVRAIAQRWDIYSANYQGSIGSYDKSRQKVRSIGGLRNGKLDYGNGKYSPLNLKGAPETGLAEFRIFQSSVRTNTIRKNMEFVWALHAWTRKSALTGISWHHEDFVRWLADHKKEYPTLVEYLSRPSFGVKSCKRTIYNTWAGLLSPTVVAQRAVVEAYDLAA